MWDPRSALHVRDLAGKVVDGLKRARLVALGEVLAADGAEDGFSNALGLAARLAGSVAPALVGLVGLAQVDDGAAAGLSRADAPRVGLSLGGPLDLLLHAKVADVLLGVAGGAANKLDEVGDGALGAPGGSADGVADVRARGSLAGLAGAVAPRLGLGLTSGDLALGADHVGQRVDDPVDGLSGDVVGDGGGGTLARLASASAPGGGLRDASNQGGFGALARLAAASAPRVGVGLPLAGLSGTVAPSLGLGLWLGLRGARGHGRLGVSLAGLAGASAPRVGVGLPFAGLARAVAPGLGLGLRETRSEGRLRHGLSLAWLAGSVAPGGGDGAAGEDRRNSGNGQSHVGRSLGSSCFSDGWCIVLRCDDRPKCRGVALLFLPLWMRSVCV